MKKSISFLVSERCNYSCYFCRYDQAKVDMIREDLEVQDYVKLFLAHKEITNNNCVNISGGDTLLYTNIEELVTNLYENGAEVSITTNGTYLEDHFSLFKYVKKVFFNIHTLNEAAYERIVGLNSQFKQIKKNIETLRSLYEDVEIVLNITNCPENNLNILELRELFEFSNKVKADIELTGINSTETWRCITFDELFANLVELGYDATNIYGRFKSFSNSKNHIYFDECIFPIDNLNSLSIKYCTETEDVVVYKDGKLSIGDFYEIAVDFYEYLKKDNLKEVLLKMESLLKDSSKNSCVSCLKKINKN